MPSPGKQAPPKALAWPCLPRPLSIPGDCPFPWEGLTHLSLLIFQNGGVNRKTEVASIILSKVFMLSDLTTLSIMFS